MVKDLIKKTVLAGIRLYQSAGAQWYHLFPIAPQCKFYPTCSEYAHQAVTKHGVSRGVALSIRRVVHCNPFATGGVDLP